MRAPGRASGQGGGRAARPGPAPAPLGAEGFAAAVDVSRETLARLERYAALLRKWNRRINLVAPGSLDDLWRRHMLDSAQLLAPIRALRPETPAPVILDLGSGAGFPGLVLAMLGAGQVHLVEADQRKAAFLREVSRETSTPVETHVARIESLDPFPVDVVTARALAPLPRLLGLAAPFLRAGAGTRRPIALLPKGRDHAEELTRAQKEWKMRVESIPSLTDSHGAILSVELL